MYIEILSFRRPQVWTQVLRKKKLKKKQIELKLNETKLN